MPCIEHCGSRVFYEERGEGRPFVFLHGLGAHRQQALSALEGLQGYRLISIDMPGHGQSLCGAAVGAGALFRFSAFADAALAVLDELEISSAVFGGISMGAGISLHVALRKPQRARGLRARPMFTQSGLPEMTTGPPLFRGEVLCCTSGTVAPWRQRAAQGCRAKRIIHRRRHYSTAL